MKRLKGILLNHACQHDKWLPKYMTYDTEDRVGDIIEVPLQFIDDFQAITWRAMRDDER